MHMRYLTRTALVVLLLLSGTFGGAAFAADAAAPASAPTSTSSDAPAPRSLMLAPPAPAAKPQHQEAPKSEVEVQQLEGITVEGKRDALSESDRRLKQLIGNLPCNGCDTKTKKIEEHRSFAEKALKATAEYCCIPTRPPEETEANELDRQLTQQIINPTNNHP